MNQDQTPVESDLADLVGSPALGRLLIYLVIEPFAWTHFRSLRRRTGLANRSLQLQVERLSALGLIERREAGRTVQYRACATHPGWPAIKGLVRHFSSPEEIFTVALSSLSPVCGGSFWFEAGAVRPRWRIVLDEPAAARSPDALLLHAASLTGAVSVVEEQAPQVPADFTLRPYLQV